MCIMRNDRVTSTIILYKYRTIYKLYKMLITLQVQDIYGKNLEKIIWYKFSVVGLVLGGWYGNNGQEPLIFSADLVLRITLGGNFLLILPIC